MRDNEICTSFKVSQAPSVIFLRKCHLDVFEENSTSRLRLRSSSEGGTQKSANIYHILSKHKVKNLKKIFRKMFAQPEPPLSKGGGPQRGGGIHKMFARKKNLRPNGGSKPPPYGYYAYIGKKRTLFQGSLREGAPVKDGWRRVRDNEICTSFKVSQAPSVIFLRKCHLDVFEENSTSRLRLRFSSEGGIQ